MEQNEVIERLVAAEERGKSNTHRIEGLESLTKAIYEQNESITELVTELKHTNEHIQDHDKRLTAIERKPADRLGQIVTAIIAAGIGALVTGMAGMMIR